MTAVDQDEPNGDVLYSTFESQQGGAEKLSEAMTHVQQVSTDAKDQFMKKYLQKQVQKEVLQKRFEQQLCLKRRTTKRAKGLWSKINVKVVAAET